MTEITAESEGAGQPHELANSIWAFQGSHNGKGECFLLSPSDDWFARLEGAGSPFLHPYFTSDDIASYGLDEVRRWVVDTEDYSLEDIKRQSPVTYEFLIEVAKPSRTAEALKPYKGLIDRWWQLWNHRAPLYRELRLDDHCVVVPFVSKYVLVAKVPTSWVFTNKLCVMKLTSPALHVALLSSFFESWVRKHGGTMGKTTMTLSLSSGVKSFPLPQEISEAAALVNSWDDAFAGLSRRVGSAFTTVMNAFNSRGEENDDVLCLRDVRSKIDATLAKAYGWSDLDLGHDFHETQQGERFTISNSARNHVLQRLLKLNHERYAEEVKQGLHKKRASKNSGARKTISKSGKASPALFDVEEDDA